MKRDPVTRLKYPFYTICAYIWNAAKEEYECTALCHVQTYEEAVSAVKNAPLNNDSPQYEIDEECYGSCETVAIMVSCEKDEETPSGYWFYDPRTNKDIE